VWWTLLACATERVGETAAPEPVEVVYGSGRNVLLITLDTLRLDRLARYGGADNMPRLEAMLGDALVLDHHRSCSNWTFSSMVCLLTGQTVLDLGWGPRTEAKVDIAPLPEDAEILSEILAGAGYQTGLVTSNPFLDPRYAFAQGYDVLRIKTSQPADVVAASALVLVDLFEAEDAPWFVHAHFMDPHSPYDPPEAYLEGLDELDELDWELSTSEGLESLAAAWADISADERAAALARIERRYAGELRYLDDQLAALLDQLDAQRALDDTVVVLATDHGEQLFDRKELGHGYDLQPEEARALVAFWAPDLEGRAWEEPTTHVDVLPTLLELLGVEHEPALSGLPVGDAPADRALFTWRLSEHDTLQDVVVGDLRLEFRWDGRRRLYDRASDPTEEDNLYTPDDERVVAMWEPLSVAVSQLDAIYEGVEPAETGP